MESASEKVLSKRILAIFLFTTAILVLQGVYNIFSLRGVNSSIAQVYESVNQVSATSSDITLPISELRQLSMSLVMAPSQSLRDQLETEVSVLQGKIDRNLNSSQDHEFSDKKSAKLFADIGEAWKGYSAAINVTKGYVHEGVRIAEFISVTIHEKSAYDKVTLAIVAYNAYQLEISAQTFQAAQSDATIAFWAVLITTVIEVATLKIILAYVLNLVRHYVASRKDHAEELKSKNEALDKSAQLRLLLEGRIKAEERIHHLRNYLSNIINSMPSVLIGVDADGTVTQWNEETARVTGLNEDYALGQPLAESFPRLAEDMPHVHKAIESRKEQKVAKRQYQQDGETLYENMTIYPLVASGVAGAVIRLDDISAAHASEAALRRAQKMEAIGQLTGGIAHDFNNILGIVMGNLELLKFKFIDDDEALQRIENALKGSQRGADITRKLLSFSRNTTQDARPTQANSIVESMQELISKSLTVSINIQTKLADDLWTVEIDPGDLEDAILNLSLNAKDAMPEGGTLVIETANKVLDDAYVKSNPESQCGDFVLISVSDDGIGMSKDVKEKALEPFFSTKEQGKGTGLGLSMVYGFAQNSGGHVGIFSELNEGTSFQIFLPRAQMKSSAVTGRNNRLGALPRGTETVLIVDDEAALIDIAAEHLKYLGYSVLVAVNAKQALKILAENSNVDLVFSDIIMPGDMDGCRLAQSVRELYPSYKILLVSGFTKKQEGLPETDSALVLELLEKRLHKPYSLSELALAVRRTLDETS